jgi:hypothetical protein
LTFLIASISPWQVKDWPATSHFLTQEERDHVSTRLVEDVNDEEHEFKAEYVWQVLKDFKMYIMVLIYLGANCGSYAIVFFLPTIIKNLGYSAATYLPFKNISLTDRTQLMTIPPYICACVVTIGCAWLSDRKGARGP